MIIMETEFKIEQRLLFTSSSKVVVVHTNSLADVHNRLFNLVNSTVPFSFSVSNDSSTFTYFSTTHKLTLTYPSGNVEHVHVDEVSNLTFILINFFTGNRKFYNHIF